MASRANQRVLLSGALTLLALGNGCACDVPNAQAPDAGIPPRPPFDCNAEATWSIAPDVEDSLRGPADIALCGTLRRAYATLPIDGRLDGGCVRVHASTDPTIPVGIYPLGTDGLVLGLAAPVEVDVEVRHVQFASHLGRWLVVSERGARGRGPIVIAQPSAIALDRPPRVLLDRAYADDESIVTTRTPPTVTAYGDAFAVGDVGPHYGVLDRSGLGGRAILRLISRVAEEGALPVRSLIQLTEPIDDADTTLLAPGVMSGTRFLMIDAESAAVVGEASAPADLVEVSPADDTAVAGLVAYGRAGSTLYRVGPGGVEPLERPAVQRVMRGGCVLTTRGELVDVHGTALGEYDPAIGAPLACHLRVVTGERGVSAIHRGRLLGRRSRLLDSVIEGRIVPTGPRGAWATERPDGTSELVPRAECE